MKAGTSKKDPEREFGQRSFCSGTDTACPLRDRQQFPHLSVPSVSRIPLTERNDIVRSGFMVITNSLARIRL